MSFNKRFFHIDLFVQKYKEDPENAISNAIGRADGFIFEDDISETIIKEWFKGDKKIANKILEDYVLRIADKTS